MLIMSAIVSRDEESASGCNLSYSAQVHVVGRDDMSGGGTQLSLLIKVETPDGKFRLYTGLLH